VSIRANHAWDRTDSIEKLADAASYRQGSHAASASVQSGRSELSTSPISASGSGRCRTTNHNANRKCANLSDAAGAHHRRLCRRRRTDITARLMGQWLSERLGQQFIIENRTGAVGNTATEAVVRAAPDGYTLLMVQSPNAINATLYDKLNFNFIRDIAPVAGIMRVPMVMEVNPSFSAKTVSEFIALCQGQSGQNQHGIGRQRNRPPCCGRDV
jgi:hypothetical protein